MITGAKSPGSDLQDIRVEQLVLKVDDGTWRRIHVEAGPLLTAPSVLATARPGPSIAASPAGHQARHRPWPPGLEARRTTPVHWPRWPCATTVGSPPDADAR